MRSDESKKKKKWSWGMYAWWGKVKRKGMGTWVVGKKK